jgi:hypothetical protein
MLLDLVVFVNNFLKTSYFIDRNPNAAKMRNLVFTSCTLNKVPKEPTHASRCHLAVLQQDGYRARSSTMAIMTPNHPLWDEFIERLDAVADRCDSTSNKPLARAILETMPDIDIDASFAFFEKYGGYCDCEILLNVVNAYQSRMEAHWDN